MIRGLRALCEFGPLRRARLPAGGRQPLQHDLQAQGLARSRLPGVCAIGVSRDSATGVARSRSDALSEVRRCAGARRRSCRSCCRRTWCPMAAAIRWRRRRRSTNATVRNAAIPARRETDTMDTFVDSVVVLLALRQLRRSNAPWSTSARGYWAAGGSVHRRHRARDPALAVFALLDARDARSWAGAMSPSPSCKSAHAGHGAATTSTLVTTCRRSGRVLPIRRT